MSNIGRVLVVQAVVFVCGAALIWAVASPLSSDGSSLGSVSWPGLLIPTLVAGLLGGASQGALLRARRRVLSIAALTLLSAPALFASLYYVGRWPGDSANTGTDPALFLAAVAAWVAFAGISLVLALALCTPQRRATPDGATRPTDDPV